jgi:hypothetical protein
MQFAYDSNSNEIVEGFSFNNSGICFYLKNYYCKHQDSPFFNEQCPWLNFLCDHCPDDCDPKIKDLWCPMKGQCCEFFESIEEPDPFLDSLWYDEYGWPR